MTSKQDLSLEIAMGKMLRTGVIIAALVVLAGGILYLRQFHAAVPEYRQFHGAPAASQSIQAIVDGIRRLNGESLIAFGILLLIATPVTRVIFGVVGFSMQRDWMYAGVSTMVLAVLLLSFIVRR
jgi:uncharacterized membrane protein